MLPSAIRRRLGLRAGDALEVNLEGERIVLMLLRTHSRKPRILADPLTGLPVLSGGPGAPTLTSEQVEEILANFP